MNDAIREVQQGMEHHGYIAERSIATAVYLAKTMRKPLLIEGDAGVGKTEIGKVLARMLGTELIRLQCYQGLDVNTALYEWNYQRQILHLKIAERDGRDAAALEAEIFGRDFLLEATSYYDPPNLTFPFGSYICVVDIDCGTGAIKIRRFVAVDDCGNIINPMIVDGQIHGGLSMGLAPALYEEISYDESGNVQGGSFMDYLMPGSMETPKWETGKTVTPCPHHPLGAKGVGESATVGAPPAIVNAVVDALAHLGVRHLEIPITPEKVWRILKDKGVAE